MLKSTGEEEEQQRSSTEQETVKEKFVEISGLTSAGLSAIDVQIFYKRNGFQSLSDLVDKIVAECHIGLIDGLPGTGKSSALWWKIRQLNRTLLWVHLDRTGLVRTVVKVDGDNMEYFHFQQAGGEGFWRQLSELTDPPGETKVEEPDITVLVVDGVNHDNMKNANYALINFVLKSPKKRCGFITMSNKIKRLHKHYELDTLDAQHKMGMAVVPQAYHTQHSWTLDEYLDACVDRNTGGATGLFRERLSVFQQDWKNIDVDGPNTSTALGRRRHVVDGSKKYVSVAEVVAQKFAFAGSSARWMATESIQSISKMISEYIRECIQLDKLLQFTLGEESPYAKTHLYYSIDKGDGPTDYSLISQNATALVVKSLGIAGTKNLYQHAMKLDNPAFIGWVMEADIMQRCTSGALVLRAKDGSAVQFTEQGKDPIEFDHDDLVNGAPVESLIPDEGATKVCKPTKWNQGGYDVIFVTAGSERKLALRFGQVTKSATHSLKLKYFAEVVSFLSTAGYVIESVEIAFIVPQKHISDFRVFPSKVSGRGLLSHADLRLDSA